MQDTDGDERVELGFGDETGRSLGFEGAREQLPLEEWLEASNPYLDYDSGVSGKTYVCYPYSGNPGKSRKVCAEVARRLVEHDWRVFAPQIYLHQFIDEDTERDKAMRHCLMEMRDCNIVLVVGDTVTEGMYAEIRYALGLGLSVIRVSEEEEWSTW